MGPTLYILGQKMGPILNYHDQRPGVRWAWEVVLGPQVVLGLDFVLGPEVVLGLH